MNCSAQTRPSPETLLDYCARRLPPDSMREVEEHLRGCSQCYSVVLRQRELWELMDEWAVQPVSGDFDVRLIDRARSEAQVGALAWSGRLFAVLRPWMATATAVAAAIAVVVWLAPVAHDDYAQKNRTISTAGAMEAQLVEAEQAERAVEDIEMLRQFSMPARKDQSI